MWLARYFVNNIYHNGGTRWLCANGIPQKCENGIIPHGLLSEDDIIRLLKVNLIVKSGNDYRLNFAVFTQKYGFDYTLKVQEISSRIGSYDVFESIRAISSGAVSFDLA